MKKKPIQIPSHYDYVGIFLTEKCHLDCTYCITKHHDAPYGKLQLEPLSATEWIMALNRLKLGKNIPITLQGGEPFLYPGIWKILENVNHKIDILTALPPSVTTDKFSALKTLEWNKRNAPYPTIRVSYHKGQNNFRYLIERIAELQEIMSIGLFYLEHPENDEEDFIEIEALAKKKSVELRKKEFLGEWNGRHYGTFLYRDAALGSRKMVNVLCKNTVVPIAPDGFIYRCHSDLYFQRKYRSLGNICNDFVEFKDEFKICENYGLCNECDVKIKTNHRQQFGYTSVCIKKTEDKINNDFKKKKSIDN